MRGTQFLNNKGVRFENFDRLRLRAGRLEHLADPGFIIAQRILARYCKKSQTISRYALHAVVPTPEEIAEKCLGRCVSFSACVQEPLRRCACVLRHAIASHQGLCKLELSNGVAKIAGGVMKKAEGLRRITLDVGLRHADLMQPRHLQERRRDVGATLVVGVDIFVFAYDPAEIGDCNALIPFHASALNEAAAHLHSRCKISLASGF